MWLSFRLNQNTFHFVQIFIRRRPDDFRVKELALVHGRHLRFALLAAILAEQVLLVEFGSYFVRFEVVDPEGVAFLQIQAVTRAQEAFEWL